MAGDSWQVAGGPIVCELISPQLIVGLGEIVTEQDQYSQYVYDSRQYF